MINMNAQEARRTIASYLVGKPVKRDTLEQAWTTLDQQNPGALSRLMDGMGLEDGHPTECDIFRENIAVFCEMSEDERVREMDDLVKHMGECQACRRLFWDITPKWKPETAAVVKQALKETVKKLAEGIRIMIDEAERLCLKGGPLPLEIQTVAATMGQTKSTLEFYMPPEGLEEAGREVVSPQIPMEWDLEDKDENCSIRLAARWRTPGEAEVTCELIHTDKGPVPAGHSRIELFDDKSNTLCVSSPLSDIVGNPLILTPGLWTIIIKWVGTEKSYQWKIPFEINTFET